VILETALILGGAVALVAVQPPLMRLFPPKPKQTEWEKFWDTDEIRKRWNAVEFDSKVNGTWGEPLPVSMCPVTVAKVEATKKPTLAPPGSHKTAKSGTFAAYESALKLHLDYTKQALEKSSKLFQEIKAEAESKPIGTLMIQTEKGLKEVPPAKLDAALSKAQSSGWTTNRYHEDAFAAVAQRQDRAAFSADAERRGMQVYLDHATNEYRARETQLSRNLQALEAALGPLVYDAGKQSYHAKNGPQGFVTIPRIAIAAAEKPEDVWKLISDKPAPLSAALEKRWPVTHPPKTAKEMNLAILEEELKRMRWENKPRVILPKPAKTTLDIVEEEWRRMLAADGRK
jgi:hypothetical protein